MKGSMLTYAQSADWYLGLYPVGNDTSPVQPPRDHGKVAFYPFVDDHPFDDLFTLSRKALLSCELGSMGMCFGPQALVWPDRGQM